MYRPKEEIYIGDSRHRCKEKQQRSKGLEAKALEKHDVSSKENVVIKGVWNLIPTQITSSPSVVGLRVACACVLLKGLVVTLCMMSC